MGTRTHTSMSLGFSPLPTKSSAKGGDRSEEHTSELQSPVFPTRRSSDLAPLYETHYGQAVVADSLGFMRALPADCIDLVMTSPPFALKRKKDYGNKDAHEYVTWFQPFANEVQRKRRG